MELKYKDKRLTIEINQELVDYAHAELIDNSEMRIPYCTNLDYYYSVACKELRAFLSAYIGDLMDKDIREDINYALPSFWLLVNASRRTIRLAVTHNTTYSGEWVYDDALACSDLQCVTRADEKKAVLDNARFLW